jgi:hypothetical protein
MGKILGMNPKDTFGLKKVSISKIPPSSIIYEALAMMNGASKYGPYNWRDNAILASVYVDALYRHVFDWWEGEELAQDSKVPHLGHAKACLGLLIDAIETGNLKDDRPKPGKAAELFARYEIKIPK